MNLFKPGMLGGGCWGRCPFHFLSGRLSFLKNKLPVYSELVYQSINYQLFFIMYLFIKFIFISFLFIMECSKYFQFCKTYSGEALHGFSHCKEYVHE